MKKLTLRTERLVDLTTDEMQAVAAGGVDTSYTSRPGCIVSYEPCVPTVNTLRCPTG